MIECPMCNNKVTEFKKNCHVLPRAFVKVTKIEGKNITLLNLAAQHPNIEIEFNRKDGDK